MALLHEYNVDLKLFFGLNPRIFVRLTQWNFINPFF